MEAMGMASKAKTRKRTNIIKEKAEADAFTSLQT